MPHVTTSAAWFANSRAHVSGGQSTPSFGLGDPYGFKWAVVRLDPQLLFAIGVSWNENEQCAQRTYLSQGNRVLLHSLIAVK